MFDVQNNPVVLGMFYAFFIDAIKNLPKEDKKEFYRHAKILFTNVTNEGEEEMAVIAMFEILARQ